MSSTSTQDNSDRETFLLGDTREELLRAVKAHIDFKNLAEKNQRALVSEVEQVARQMIRRVANVTASKDRPCSEFNWNEWKKTKDGRIEVKGLTLNSQEIRDNFSDHTKGVLVFVDPDVFMGERGASEIFPDQPDLMEQAKPADDERPIAEVNAERLRKGIKPLPVEEGEGEPTELVDEGTELPEEATELDSDFEEVDGAPPTQPADADLVEQTEEEGEAEPLIGDAEEVETPPVTLDKPVGRRRPPRAPRARDVSTGE